MHSSPAVLNDAFVSIKVDREERPDVDAVYMEAVQAISGSGGWPMSVFLTPDGRPFYGGTYFPPDDRHGLPSFRAVLAALTDAWDHRRAAVEEQADELASAVAARSTLARPAVDPGEDAAGTRPPALDRAVAVLDGQLDPEWGGFGTAPKFPQPALVDAALRQAEVATDEELVARARRMAELTLDGMAAGGIHDHLGGGFCRYSTDARWLVPHFEKMLYDQAGLLRAFVHGWQVTDRDAYRRVAEGIVSYVSRDLTLPSGGVCSAEDADSEGEEGRFYVWTLAEVDRAVSAGLGTAEGDPVAAATADFFGVSAGPNFEGRSIFFRPLGATLEGPTPVETGRRLLFETRSLRPRPALDDKVLTEWNAMYASALAEAAAATGRDDWARAATSVGDFLLANLRRADGRWLRSWQVDAGARHLAYAADYAWLVDCFTRLGELTGTARWTAEAVAAADGLVDLFHDDEGGGFYTTGHDAEPLLVRPKDVLDGAVPSANGTAAVALARLAALTSSPRYAELAAEVVALARPLVDRHPTAVAQAVVAADLLAGGVVEVVVPGDHRDLVDAVRSRWRPTSVLAWGESTGSPLWEHRQPGLAYVCHGGHCELPAPDVAALRAQLDAAGTGS